MLIARRLGILVLRSVKAFFDDGCSQRAAAISYYVLFSLFPLLIFSVGIMGLVLKDQKLQTDVVDTIMNNIPLSQDKGRNDVTHALQNVAQHAAAAPSASSASLGLAWSGSSMFGVVRSSLNNVFHGAAHRPRSCCRSSSTSRIVLAFAPFFIGSIVATSALRYARTASEDVPVLGDLPESLGPAGGSPRLVLPIVISCVAFFLIYWLVPARRTSPGTSCRGALLAAVLFEIVKDRLHDLPGELQQL